MEMNIDEIHSEMNQIMDDLQLIETKKKMIRNDSYADLQLSYNTTARQFNFRVHGERAKEITLQILEEKAQELREEYEVLAGKIIKFR